MKRKLSYDGHGINLDGQRFATISEKPMVWENEKCRALTQTEIDDTASVIVSAVSLWESLQEKMYSEFNDFIKKQV